MLADVFRIPPGFYIIAQGCGTPLPWVSNIYFSLFSTPTELRRFSHTALVPKMTQPRWGKRKFVAIPPQGSGVPQPWALLLNLVGILNSNIRFSFLLFVAKDVDNDKRYAWEHIFYRQRIDMLSGCCGWFGAVL